MYVESVSLTLIFGHPITTSSSGPLNCFHSSEVTFIYDCPLKRTGLFPGNLMHGLLLCVGKAKQTFQIAPHYGLLVDVVLGHQREQGDIASKDQEKIPFSLRNAKRMNKKLCNLCILGISRVLSLKLCNLAPINHM